MKIKFSYFTVLIAISTILAINLLYFKPYYIQLLVALIFIIIAYLLKRFIPHQYYLLVLTLLFFPLIYVSARVYDSYESKVYDNCKNPLFKKPTEEIGTFYTGYNPKYYKDEHFQGIISFGNDRLYVFNLIKQEKYYIQIVTDDYLYPGDESHNKIMSVQYHDGFIYISKTNLTKRTTDVFLVDVNTKEIVNTATYITNNRTSYIYQLNDTIYIEGNETLYRISEDLTITNGFSFIGGTSYIKAYNNYYLVLRQTDNGYEFRIYNQAFDYVKTLVESSSMMMASENNDGELFISVDSKFYVYDNTLIKINEIEMVNRNDTVLSFIEFEDHYYVKKLAARNLRYHATSVYDKSFKRKHECLFENRLYSRNIFFIDDHIYVTDQDKIYKINEDDYFKAKNTLTFQEPIKENALFYLAVILYPCLCIKWLDDKNKY